MPFSFKILQAGSFAPTTACTYTVTSPVTSAIVANLRFLNDTDSHATVEIQVGVSTDVRRVGIVPVAARSQAVFNTELTLASGESVKAVVSSSTVHCLICGVNRY